MWSKEIIGWQEVEGAGAVSVNEDTKFVEVSSFLTFVL
jgi:hypothetical protein